jgi:hypothetical protein
VCDKKRTAKALYRAKCYRVSFAVRFREKTHGRGFGVRFMTFVVRSKRTANSRFPVVTTKK